MGNTCAHPHTHHNHNHHQHTHNQHNNYYVAKEQSVTGRSLASNRTEVSGNSTRQGNSTTATKLQRFQIEEKHVAPPSIVAVTGQGTTPSKIQTLEIKEKEHVVPPTENSDQSEQERIKLVAPRVIGGISKLELEKNVITVAISSQADEPLIPQSNEDKKTPAITTTDTVTEEPPTFEGGEKNTSSGCRHVPDEEWEEEDKGKDLVLISNERDECPTCLEGYDEENPKIVTKCNHHYHLGCIFEWMERSTTCPMCFRVMEFQETS